MIFILGPCVLEDEAHTILHASKLKELRDNFGIQLYYKSSYHKDNRTKHDSPRGPGLTRGRELLKVARQFLPVVTDVHDSIAPLVLAREVDMLQVPAMLSRQSSILEACAKSGRPVMIKKGQFMSPEDAQAAVEKVQNAGCTNVYICERGTSFGYNNLVVDFVGVRKMQKMGLQVILDCTHSVPEPRHAWDMARIACAMGLHGIFAECHKNPERAPSDSKKMLRLGEMESFIGLCLRC